jgi:hypothetical protein
MEGWRQPPLGGRKNLVQQTSERIDLTPIGLLMEGDYGTTDGILRYRESRIWLANCKRPVRTQNVTRSNFFSKCFANRRGPDG